MSAVAVAELRASGEPAPDPPRATAAQAFNGPSTIPDTGLVVAVPLPARLQELAGPAAVEPDRLPLVFLAAMRPDTATAEAMLEPAA